METIKRSTPELHACVQSCPSTFGPWSTSLCWLHCNLMHKSWGKNQSWKLIFNFWLTPGTISVMGEHVKWVNWSFFYIVSNVRLRGRDEGYICSLTCTHMHTYTGCGCLDLSGQGLLPRANLTVEHWDCCAWFWSLWFSPDLASKYTAASRNSTLSSGEARHGKFRPNKKDREEKRGRRNLCARSSLRWCEFS